MLPPRAGMLYHGSSRAIPLRVKRDMLARTSSFEESHEHGHLPKVRVGVSVVDSELSKGNKL